MPGTITTTDEEASGGWAGDGFDWVDAASIGFWTGASTYGSTPPDPGQGFQWGSAWSGQFDNVEGGGFTDEAGDAVSDAAEQVTPAWLRWVLNHQEEVVVLLVLLAFAAATNGTVSVGGGSGA